MQPTPGQLQAGRRCRLNTCGTSTCTDLRWCCRRSQTNPILVLITASAGPVYLCIHCVTNISRLTSFQSKTLEKHSLCFPFALRCHECDGWLLVNPKLSTIPVCLFTHVYPLRVAELQGSGGPRAWSIGMWRGIVILVCSKRAKCSAIRFTSLM